MDNNLSSCTTIIFEPLDQISEELTSFLDEIFEVSALNYTDDGKEEYVGYADLAFDLSDLRSAAQRRGLTLPCFRVEKLLNKNWLTENVIRFDPIDTTDFCVYGIHEKEAPKSNKLLLKIYAATAFGSGHQTTKGCLEALGFLKRRGLNPQHILDVGTGSGILSLGSALLWADQKPEIVAVDIDDESVRVAMQNAFDNHLEENLYIAQSDGYKAEVIDRFAPYDLILSNILARPLIDMAPDLSAHLKKGGFCVLSGFVDDQIEWVTSAHEAVGLHFVRQFDIDCWHAVVMEKK